MSNILKHKIFSNYVLRTHTSDALNSSTWNCLWLTNFKLVEYQSSYYSFSSKLCELRYRFKDRAPIFRKMESYELREFHNRIIALAYPLVHVKMCKGFRAINDVVNTGVSRDNISTNTWKFMRLFPSEKELFSFEITNQAFGVCEKNGSYELGNIFHDSSTFKKRGDKTDMYNSGDCLFFYFYGNVYDYECDIA